jgi:hypothetical protein
MEAILNKLKNNKKQNKRTIQRVPMKIIFNNNNSNNSSYSSNKLYKMTCNQKKKDQNNNSNKNRIKLKIKNRTINEYLLNKKKLNLIDYYFEACIEIEINTY